MRRRTVLAGLGATLAAPALAAAPRWDAWTERAAGFEQLRSVAVWTGGEEVLARRVRGPAIDTPVNVKSVSKSVVSALLGVAVGRGEVALGDTLGDVAPRLIPRAADPKVAQITLEDLASMRAGLERTSGANYGPWISSPNWVADALARPFVAEPGGRMLYSTGSTHVLGAALAVATGESLLDQARSRLGRPLGLSIPPWTRDPQGYYMGGNQMALSLRDMGAFGELYRLDGVRDGARILPEGWVETSWTPRVRSPWSGLGYGLGWFVGRERGNRVGIARGYGGQVIAVSPEVGLTVAITSDPDRPARSQGYFGDLMGLVREAVGIAA